MFNQKHPSKEYTAKRSVKSKWREKRKLIRKLKEERFVGHLEAAKRAAEAEQAATNHEMADFEAEPSEGRLYTVSVAIPGSILDNAQTPELRTYLAGQVARAAAIFEVDEIVVFDEFSKTTEKEKEESDEFQCAPAQNSNVLMVKILRFLECPQYLRKHLYPIQRDLRYAGLLNPLDCFHHFRASDLSVPYREGIVLDKSVKAGQGSFVYVGLNKEVQIDRCLQPNVRLTVKFDVSDINKKRLRGIAVNPTEPTSRCGYYWGYSVRLARSFTKVFSECPYPEGYDLTVGTSERGEPLDHVEFHAFKHLLVMFGGLKGLEACVENDEDVTAEKISELFNHYINTCPKQGSRTIRTEEAILISLSAMRPKILAAQTQRMDEGSES